jgi:Fe-S oxidoreductase
MKSLKQNGNPWGGKKENRLNWIRGAKLPAYSPEHEYCLFTCCATAYDNSAGKGNQKADLALLRLLEHAGVSYGTLGPRERCCGDLADCLGSDEVAADLARKNTDMFLEAGVTKILTISPHCLNSFKRHYAGLEKVAATHATELLAELVEKGSLKPAHRLDLKVTYHDPCYLGRHAAIYEAPRRILAAIPGVTLVEMQNHRERSFCCGGGSGGCWKDNGRKEGLGDIRIKEALGTGAEVIATACPYCMRMLNESITKLGAGNRIKVRDIAELLLESIDLADTTVQTGKHHLSVSQEDLRV